MYVPALIEPVRRIGARTFDFSRQVAVMAVVNRTPDSFYDRGATFALDAAVAAGVAATDAGADWVDIGGVPFAPGPALDPRDEIARVVPVVERLRGVRDVVISVDTFDADVAQAALAAGADVINDTTGLHDPRLAGAVAAAEATLVITHSLAATRGAGPRTQFGRPQYADVVIDVRDFLAERVAYAIAEGVGPNRIIVDPGHDLNKTTPHSLELTRRLAEIAELGHPVLAAVSNKDFVGETLAAPREARLEGSLATAVVAIMQGARVVRMHNIRESVAAVRMTEAILGWRDPAGPLVHNMGDINLRAESKGTT